MKKIIIVAALILSTGVTAFSLTSNNDKAAQQKVKTENSTLALKASSSPKSDIATAD